MWLKYRKAEYVQRDVQKREWELFWGEEGEDGGKKRGGGQKSLFFRVGGIVFVIPECGIAQSRKKLRDVAGSSSASQSPRGDFLSRGDR